MLSMVAIFLPSPAQGAMFAPMYRKFVLITPVFSWLTYYAQNSCTRYTVQYNHDNTHGVARQRGGKKGRHRCRRRPSGRGRNHCPHVASTKAQNPQFFAAFRCHYAESLRNGGDIFCPGPFRRLTGNSPDREATTSIQVTKDSSSERWRLWSSPSTAALRRIFNFCPDWLVSQGACTNAC